MERYIDIFESKFIVEAFYTSKPTPEAGYTIKKKKKRVDGKIVTGWVKTLKKGRKSKKSKTGLTKSQLKKRARKAKRTLKKRPGTQRRAKRKAKKTRKLNK